MSPSYRLPHVCILGPISLYAKDIYCSRTKSIFKNYSAKLELIGTIFYRETSIQVARFCGNFWRRPPNGREIVTKFARTVRTFCHQKNASFHPPLNSRFPWNLNTKPESVSSWILSEQNYEIFSDKRSLTRQNLNFSVFGTLLHDARDPAFASRSLQRIWALHLIVEGPRCFLIRRCFPYDLSFSRRRRANSSPTSGKSAKFRVQNNLDCYLTSISNSWKANYRPTSICSATISCSAAFLDDRDCFIREMDRSSSANCILRNLNSSSFACISTSPFLNACSVTHS